MERWNGEKSGLERRNYEVKRMQESQRKKERTQRRRREGRREGERNRGK